MCRENPSIIAQAIDPTEAIKITTNSVITKAPILNFIDRFTIFISLPVKYRPLRFCFSQS